MTVERVGGHLALDFVNTVAWRLDEARCDDRIPDCPALVRWAESVGVLGEGLHRKPKDHAVIVERARTLREVLYRVLQPMATGDPPPGGDVAFLRQAMTGALAEAEIETLVPLRWRIRTRGPADLPATLAIHAWRLLQFEDLTRLRQCADGGCGWLFLDRSKNGSRRWCSSADCGNRARARRHYQQRR